MARKKPQADLIQFLAFKGSHVTIVLKHGDDEITSIALSIEETREMAVQLYALADECEDVPAEIDQALGPKCCAGSA
jgi:hypothetical protein